jgi:hypothetical protein
VTDERLQNLLRRAAPDLGAPIQASAIVRLSRRRRTQKALALAGTTVIVAVAFVAAGVSVAEMSRDDSLRRYAGPASPSSELSASTQAFPDELEGEQPPEFVLPVEVPTGYEYFGTTDFREGPRAGTGVRGILLLPTTVLTEPTVRICVDTVRGGAECGAPEGSMRIARSLDGVSVVISLTGEGVEIAHPFWEDVALTRDPAKSALFSS